MKRYLYLYGCLAIIVSFMLFSCIKDYLEPEHTNNDPNGLTVAQAKEFFERQISESLSTRTAHERRDLGLTPGEYTPEWTKSQTPTKKRGSSLSFPIIAQYRYCAITSTVKNGKAKAHRVPMEQKLVVIKDDNGQLYSYILTLIPTREYSKKKSSGYIDKFLNNNDRAKFSGTAIYCFSNG